MASLTLINEWGTNLVEGSGATLSGSPENTPTHFIFDGITWNNETLGEDDNKVSIGIYQTNDSVYAFASTNAEAEASSGNVKIGDNDATLIATGSGNINKDDDNQQITDIAITLKGDDNPGTLKKLGFSGEAITNITGSDKGDTVYIIKDENETNSISTKAKLDFSQGGNDTAFFTGKSSVSMILGGG